MRSRRQVLDVGGLKLEDVTTLEERDAVVGIDIDPLEAGEV
jgi:hypothetical protein